MRRIGPTAAFLALLAMPGLARAAEEAIEISAAGVQIYVCDAGASGPGFAWRLKAPEATLTDAQGAEFGVHFAGPTWRAKDGSTVAGEVLIASPAPGPGAIPWVLLRAKSHEGSGILTTVRFIARTHTEGGRAPEAGCDAARSGTEQRVPYKAVYVFFRQG